MNMDYDLKNSIFLHVPKTGGSWVKQALTDATDLVVHRGGSWHAIPKRGRHSSKFWFCFVRHPETWYQSYWCFNDRHNKWKNGPCNVLSRFPHSDFNTFVEKVTLAYPQGFLSTYLYPKYTEESDFVGHYESIVEDLISALIQAQEQFDADKIRDMSSHRRNVASTLPEYAARCIYREDVRLRMLQAENSIIRQYYAN